MKLRESGSGRLEGRAGGGCLAIFGLPFLLAGLFVAIGGSLGMLESEGGEPAPIYFVLPFGLIFATVGAILVFGRYGIVIDRNARQVTTWYGLLVPMKSTQHPLGVIDEVRITKEIRRSDKSTRTVYPVRLAGGAQPIDINETTDYGDSRQLAEQLATFLDLPVVDRSSGQAVRREAAELDLSLRDRIAQKGEPITWPEPPTGMRSSYEVIDDAVRIHIPAPGLTAVHGLVMLGGLVPVGVVAAFLYFTGFLDDGFMDDDVGYVFLGFLGFFFGVVPLLLTAVPALNNAVEKTDVFASPEELRVTWSGLLTRSRTIPTTELEELELTHNVGLSRQGNRFLGGSTAIIARSDTTTIQLAPRVDGAETHWIHGAIRYVVTGAA